MEDKKLQIVIDAVDKASNVLKNTETRIQSMGNKFKNAGEKMQSAGTKMMAIGAAIAVGLGKGFDEIDRGMDAVTIGTGATGKQLKSLQKIVENIAKDTPSSFEDIGNAVAEVNTRLGLTGKKNETLSRQFLNLSRLLGTDVKETIRNVTRSMLDMGVETENMSDYLDALMVVSQKTGVDINNLTDLMTNYGVQLRAVGLSAEDSMLLLSKWEKEGVSTEKMLPGLSMAMGRLARAGKEPSKAFWELVDSIKGAKTEGEAIRMAMEVLGAKAGPDFALAVREGRFELGNMREELKESKGAIEETDKATRDFAESFKILKNKGLLATKPILDSFAETLDNKITPAIERTLDKIGKFIEENPKLAQTINKVILLLVGGGGMLFALGKVAVAVGFVISKIALFVKGGLVLLGIGSLLGLMWISLKGGINSTVTAFHNLKNTTYFVANALRSVWEWAGRVIAPLKNIAKQRFPILYNALSSIKNIIKDTWDWAKKLYWKLIEIARKAKNIPIIGKYLKGATASPVKGSWQTGTPYVPETGLYQLHRGEAVIPEKINRKGYGNNIAITFTGNHFYSPEEIADKIDDVLMKKLKRNFKVVPQF